jgi:hypothetical protein
MREAKLNLPCGCRRGEVGERRRRYWRGRGVARWRSSYRDETGLKKALLIP